MTLAADLCMFALGTALPYFVVPKLLGQSSGSTIEPPITVIVTVEIEPARIAAFLECMRTDAVGSIQNENGGCLAFDVLRDNESPNKFYFYEMYKDAAAHAAHKSFPHYAVWTAFIKEGGVLSQNVIKTGAIIRGSSP